MTRLLIFFLLFPLSALATDDKRTTVETEVTTSNTTNLEDGRGLGLSNSLGDVAISGCLGSTQWATPLFSKQKLSMNWTCLAEFYLHNQRWELASIALCNTEIRREFPDEYSCRMAHTFGPIEQQPGSDHVDHEQVISEQQAIIELQQDTLQIVTDRVSQLEQRPTTIIAKDPALEKLQKEAAERRSKAREILEGSE